MASTTLCDSIVAKDQECTVSPDSSVTSGTAIKAYGGHNQIIIDSGSRVEATGPGGIVIDVATPVDTEEWTRVRSAGTINGKDTGIKASDEGKQLIMILNGDYSKGEIIGGKIAIDVVKSGMHNPGGYVLIDNRYNATISGGTTGIQIDAGTRYGRTDNGIVDNGYIYGRTTAIDAKGDDVLVQNDSGIIGKDGSHSAKTSKTGIDITGANARIYNENFGTTQKLDPNGDSSKKSRKDGATVNAIITGTTIAINIGSNGTNALINNTSSTNNYIDDKKVTHTSTTTAIIGGASTSEAIVIKGNSVTVNNANKKTTGSASSAIITGKTVGIKVIGTTVKKGIINNTGSTISATDANGNAINIAAIGSIGIDNNVTITNAANNSGIAGAITVTDASSGTGINIASGGNYVEIDNGTASTPTDNSYIFGATTAINAGGTNVTIANNSGFIGSNDGGSTVSKIGIQLAGDNSTINNNTGGTITGDIAIDVTADVKKANITNDGGTIDGTATGINVIGDNTIVNNYGSGLIESAGGDGINIVGNNAIINNNDKSTISGKTGIDISGDNAKVINKSHFTVKGTDFGIKITGAGTNIINSGTISGSTAAIKISGKNTTVTNNAGSVIKYTGASKTYKNAAIYADADATINNYGTISGGGSIALNVDDVPAKYGYAIAGTSATKQTVNIYDGSKFIGGIDLAANLPQVLTTAESNAIKHDVVNVYDTGSKGSYRFQVRHLGSTDIKIQTGSNAVKVDYRSNLIYVQNGSPDETVEVINASGAALRSLQLYYLTKNLHNAVRDHLEHLNFGKQSSTAAANLNLSSESNSSNKFYQSTNPQLWGQVFGERVNRDAEGNVSAYENKLAGFVGGYQHDLDKGNIGMMAGYAKANLTTTNNNQDDDTNSFYIGIYGQNYFGKLNLITSLIVGQETHENRRKITSISGESIARSDNNSLFLSPSVTLYSAFKLGDYFTLRPSTSLDYSAGRYGAYTETGADPANSKVKARTTDSALAKMQLELAYALPVGEIDLTAGAQYRYNGNKDIAMSISGSDFRYKSGIDDTVYGGYAGLGVNFDLTKKFHLTIASKYGKFVGDEQQIAGKAQLQYDL